MESPRTITFPFPISPVKPYECPIPLGPTPVLCSIFSEESDNFNNFEYPSPDNALHSNVNSFDTFFSLISPCMIGCSISYSPYSIVNSIHPVLSMSLL